MTDFDFDFSELRNLAKDIGEVPGNSGPFLRQAFEVTNLKIKKSTQKSLQSASPRWRRLAGAVDYEITVGANGTGSVIESEVGYDKDKVLPRKARRPGDTRPVGPGTAGNLGNLREFGKPGLAPHLDLQKALAENEGDFETGITKAIDDALKASGL